MMSNSLHELDFDGIDFTGRTDYNGLRFYALSDGSTFGNPIPVDREITTALLDGSFVVTDRHGNREPAFQVQIEAADSVLLERGQAMLFASCSRQVLLGWKPCDGWGPRKVYKAFTSHLEHVFDDMDEMNMVRAFNLRLICDPWAYAENETVTVASTPVPPAPSTVVISDGTSATGWSSPASAAAQPAVSSGRLAISARTDYAANTYHDGWVSEATRTLTAVDLSATPYITADIKAASQMRLYPCPEGFEGKAYQPAGNPKTGPPTYGSGAASTNLTLGINDPTTWAAAYVDGARLTLSNYKVLADGTVRYTWFSGDTSASTLRLVAGTRVADGYNYGSSPYAPTGAAAGVLLDNVERSNVGPNASTSGRRLIKTLEVGGSARTTASIMVEHPTQGLGDTLFYSSAALGDGGYSPTTGEYLAAGPTVTADTTAISGNKITSAAAGSLAAPIVWNVPASRLPAGPYLVMARARPDVQQTNLQTLSLKVEQVEGATVYGTYTFPVTFTLAGGVSPATTWPTLTTMGAVTLPVQNVPDGSSASVRFTMSLAVASPTTARFVVDSLLLFYLGDGSDITRVDCGSGAAALGAAHNRLFIDQPTPFRPKPGLFVGTLADRSDAYDPGFPAVNSRGIHPILPGANQCFVITVGAQNPTVTFRYTAASF